MSAVWLCFWFGIAVIVLLLALWFRTPKHHASGNGKAWQKLEEFEEDKKKFDENKERLM